MVTRLNNTEFLINPDLIECIEETPDTVITLSTGKKIVVTESGEEITNKIVEYRKRTFEGLFYGVFEKKTETAPCGDDANQ